MDPIRIFVGTDPWQRDSEAEQVLEHSIRANTDAQDIEITYMRSGDPGWEISETGEGDTWAVGAATAGGWVKAPGRNWGTPFSCFRFAVPELCNFEGHAIYMDSDMLVLGDIAKLWNDYRPGDAGYRSVSLARTDVSVIDCGWFKDRKWWPQIDEMKSTRARVFEYTQMMRFKDAIEPTLPPTWNDCDGELLSMGKDVDLIHYTTVPDGQPWRPYDNVKYPDDWPYCRNGQAGKLWWEWHGKTMEAMAQ